MRREGEGEGVELMVYCCSCSCCWEEEGEGRWGRVVEVENESLIGGGGDVTAAAAIGSL